VFRKHLASRLTLPLLLLGQLALAQVQPGAPVLGPDYNRYNADHLPEHDPAIAELMSAMTAEEAIAILQRELAGAQFFGLDGVKAEHWGTPEAAPGATAARTLAVDREGLSWRTMAQDEEGEGDVVVSFSFADAVQVWTRFSMAHGTPDSDPPAITPQGVVLYLLSDGGVDDVMEEPIPLSKILPSYPGALPSYSPDTRGIRLTQPGLFLAEGRPGGFAVCCFSSTGFGLEDDPQLSLERLPLVIAALQTLSPNLETPDLRGLMLTNPLASPTPEESQSILALCNRGGFDNQGVFLCQHDQLHGLAYMTSHGHGMMQDLIVICTSEWVDNYLEQAKCVLNTMMDPD
jgi:hypothetical protein